MTDEREPPVQDPDERLLEYALGEVLRRDAAPDLTDEIVSETLVAEGGEVKHERIREMLGMPPLEAAAANAEAQDSNTEISGASD